jgi:ATP-dependent protease HslVU (ClpYQ) peptidase subunit
VSPASSPQQPAPMPSEAEWRAQGAADVSYHLRAAVEQVIRQYEADRALRRLYAWWLLGVLIGEVMAAITLLVLMSTGILHPPTQWVAEVFFGGVFAQSAKLALAVTYGLFRDTLSALVRLLPHL